MVKAFLQGKWLKHPLHPIVAHIPVALWPAALVFDLLSQMGPGGNSLVRLSFAAILFGLAAALVALPTGFVDWVGIKKENPAWKIGVAHLAVNVVATLLYAVNLGLRLRTVRAEASVEPLPLALSVAGTLVIFVSAYLGGLMVYHYGVSVARMSKEKWRKAAEAGRAHLPPKQEKGDA